MAEKQSMTIEAFNALPDAEAREVLSRCCGARRWVEQVAGRRPTAAFDELLVAADEAFATLERADWLEAFAHHPKIGDPESARTKFVPTAEWASEEQAGLVGARETLLEALAEANRAYEEKFGYVFVVSAAGKSADELLGALEDRLPNDPDEELGVAATEQMKITHVRLHKVFGGEGVR
jgi:2-oxo-4-hydroxy-4-carboxy-5-ureidoimidazoline decarboxylase